MADEEEDVVVVAVVVVRLGKECGERGDTPDAQQIGAPELATSRAPATCAAVAARAPHRWFEGCG